MKPFPLLLVPLALLLAQCKKADQAPADQLPPATQTGANTFGCLVNGQPWTPSGFVGMVANYRVIYDAGISGGDLQIRVYRIVPELPNSQYFLLDSAPITKLGTYPLDGATGGAYYATGTTGTCAEYYYRTPGERVRGQLTISRLDLSAGVVAGTFAFTLSQPGCDTIKVTQGRFDKKI